ncbi:hypothetical protein G6O67_007171 [Ophiocordyceps sinensis]|uniref:High mobility group, superfamily n=1 Tax=Ophiocordyceps sinensis TaxID=72228 RepID=A0A8H4PL76_9HYPO|nr:hypothetical protein G6O67_007171 [Ophiocordyceps sinensis]
MTRELEAIFAELGLSQYLDSFIDQGFDAWDTILDIQESDLDALGVKLGHRRKLQRRIANARGIAPSVSLASTSKQSFEENKQDSPRRESCRPEAGNETAGVTKRKYRRHPKPDEHAPERPPSAYVLFSNKMRDDLKSHSLTFTEIAKLVGENWQSLPPAEKELYESQANAAKEKYHNNLAGYKKTPEYHKYAQYLQEFKERQAKQIKGHDASKRPKLEPTRLRHGSSSSGVTPGGATSSGSRSGSSSERLQGSEPPPTRHERMNSAASLAGSQPSSTAPTPMPYADSIDEGGLSPRTATHDSASPREVHQRHSRRQPSWARRNRAASAHKHHLPSLSDMLDNGKSVKDTRMTDVNALGAGSGASGQLRLVPDGTPNLPSARVPMLRHEPSSNSTVASRSSTGSFSRNPGEGSLPIHALLADRTMSVFGEMGKQSVPAIKAAVNRSGHLDSRPEIRGPRGYGFQSESSAFQKMKFEQSGEGDVVMTSVDASPPAPAPALGNRGKGGYDGMNALLRAGEIVDRNGHQ